MVLHFGGHHLIASRHYILFLFPKSRLIWSWQQFDDAKINEKIRKIKSCAANLYQIQNKFRHIIEHLVKVPKYRRALLLLRVTSHRLAIETGRHPPIPAIERICRYCHLQNIDDELHCITECDLHAIERGHLYEIVQKYVPNFIAKNNRDRFVDILTSPDGDILRTLGKYIFSGFEKRNANVV